MYIPDPDKIPQHRLDKMRKDYQEEMRMAKKLDDAAHERDMKQLRTDREKAHKRNNQPIKEETTVETEVERQQREHIQNKIDNAAIDRFNDAVERLT